MTRRGLQQMADQTFVRTKTQALGGLTAEEARRLEQHAKIWIDRALRTAPIEPDKITPAIYDLYAATGLGKPRVYITTSPLAAVLAYGELSAVRGDYVSIAPKINQATHQPAVKSSNAATAPATQIAIFTGTRLPIFKAIANPVIKAISTALNAPSSGVEKSAVEMCSALSGGKGLALAQHWTCEYQGGNLWADEDCWLTAFRDVLGLNLAEYAAFSAWEMASIHGGFRIMHKDFCIVSDFPERIYVDADNCGSSHRWRDGWVSSSLKEAAQD